MELDNTVQFYRGSEATYINTNKEVPVGADVAYNDEYKDGVFFAKDTKVIYVNGIRYGFYNSFDSSTYTDTITFIGPTPYEPAKLAYKDSQTSTIHFVNLFRVLSGSPAVDVSIDSSSNYKIGLNFSQMISTDGRNSLITDNEGQLAVFLGVERDSENSVLRFGSFDRDGSVFTPFATISDAEYLLDTYIESVSTTTQNDASVLRFTWNRNFNGDKEHDKTTVDITFEDLLRSVNKRIDECTINGKLIHFNPVLEGGDISIGEYNLVPDSSGDYDCSVYGTDSISQGFAKLVMHIQNLNTANEDDKKNIINDVQTLYEDVSVLQHKTDIIKLGDGDVVTSIYNDADTSVLTISTYNVSESMLKNYDTSIGGLTAADTINSAVQTLDERTVWQYFHDTKTE